ncbi:MAG: hypothetical protein ACW980_22340 [Promethearchaeota archaeon]
MMVTLIGMLISIGLTGCSWLSVKLTPQPVVDGVARGGAVARIAEQNPPEGENLQEYLRVNRELWEQLEIWFELRSLNE